MIPFGLTHRFPAPPVNKSLPVFSKPVESYQLPDSGASCALNAKAKDMAFILTRDDEKLDWTAFNRETTEHKHDVTKVAYMPVMLESVNDCDTLNTIVIRALKLCEEFNQTHSIITADEAVYSGLIKLRWVTPGYHQRLILRLGGLHVSMAFEATIGQHMAGNVVDCLMRG